MSAKSITCCSFLITTALGTLLLIASYRAHNSVPLGDSYPKVMHDQVGTCAGRLQNWIDGVQYDYAHAGTVKQASWSPVVAVRWHLEQQTLLLYCVLLGELGSLWLGFEMIRNEQIEAHASS